MEANGIYPVQAHEVSDIAMQAVRDCAGAFEADFTEDNLLWKLEGLDAMATWLEREKVRQVARLRVAGSSWSEIGDALGVSKQAAAKKYGGSPAK